MEKYLINPEDLLKVRFGKGFNTVIKSIPSHLVISYFNYSTHKINQRGLIIKTINWFGNYCKYYWINYKGIELGLMCLPPGGNISAMVLEEMIYCGVENVISIGLAGSLSSYVSAHDLFIPTESFGEDGVSNLYFLYQYRLKSSELLNQYVERTLEREEIPYHKGICWSISSPYRESLRKIKLLQKEGVQVVDMESASLFAIANYHKIHLSSIFSISDDFHDGVWRPHFKDKMLISRKYQLLYIALESLLYRKIQLNKFD